MRPQTLGQYEHSAECSEMACVVLTSWYLNLPSSESTLLTAQAPAHEAGTGYIGGCG
jgi:hypothetical protein